MEETAGTTPCPRCGEEIKSAALVCRFCGADLAGGPPPAPEPHSQAVMPPPPPPSPPTAVAVASGPPPADFVMKRGYGFGIAVSPRFHLENGMVTFAIEVLSPEGRRKRWLWMSPMLVGLLAVLGFVLAVPVIGGHEPPAWWMVGFAISFVTFLIGAIVGAVGQTMNIKRNSLTQTTTFPVSAVANASLAFDWDLGCALSILLSPLLGMIIMFSLGKRSLKITAPFIPEKGMASHRFIARNGADARALVDLLALWRSAAPPSV